MGRHSNLPRIYDFCLQLSISDLKKWGYLKSNHIKYGTVRFTQWGNTSEISIVVNTSEEKDYLELSYSINAISFNYKVYFTFKPSNLGKGIIYYFECSRSGKRCRNLYLMNGYFQHRTNEPGYYQTQTVGRKDRYLIRQFDKSRKSDQAKYDLSQKHLKRYYRSKPTKQYLKLLFYIREGEGINVHELLK